MQRQGDRLTLVSELKRVMRASAQKCKGETVKYTEMIK